MHIDTSQVFQILSLPETQQSIPNATDIYGAADKTQIGTGFMGMRPVTQSGAVMLSVGGAIALTKTNGELIASAPWGQWAIKSMPWYMLGQGFWLTVSGKRYSVFPGHGRVPAIAPGYQVARVAGATAEFYTILTDYIQTLEQVVRQVADAVTPTTPGAQS